MVSINQSEDGTSEDRLVRFSQQCQAENVLELPTGPRSQGSGRLSTSMAKERIISVSTLVTDSTGFTENSRNEIERGSLDNTMVANTILVPHLITDESTTTPNSVQSEEKLDNSRLALIGNKWTSDGINQITQEFFLKANRSKTHSLYNGNWKKFTQWCQKQTPIQRPEEYSVPNVLGFLIEYNQLSTQTLNGYRSAIVSVYSQIHKNQPPIASQPEIVRFFKAKKDTEVQILTIDKLETWDLNILIEFIRTELAASTNLNLGQLQLKVVLLMCINTMWRPRTDIGRIQWRDVQFTYTEEIINGVRLHIRQPKESNMKTIQLGLIDEEDLCFVRNLSLFMDLTRNHRHHLSEDANLFLGYLEVDTKPTTSLKPGTVGNWVQMAMRKAGIDVRYKAHSLCSAASTKAVILGVPVD